MKKITFVFFSFLLFGTPIIAQNFQEVVTATTEEEVDDICRAAGLGFMSTPREIEDVVNDILNTVGIRHIDNAGFELKNCDQTNNAIAKMLKDNNGKDVRYVLYDANWLGDMINKTNDSWSAKFVLAHEIGHHMLGHSLNNGSSNHQYELDADYWAGRALANMGATEEQTISATSILPERASSTHPARSDRELKAREGWNSVERTRVIKVKEADIDERGKQIVNNVFERISNEYTSLSKEEFTKFLQALNLARTDYYKAYTENIRYLEAICLTGMEERSSAETAYINYLSIENLENKSRIKQIVKLYVDANTDKSSFFQNPEVLYQLAKECYKQEYYDKAINYANQFHQFGDVKSDKLRLSEMNKLIGDSEFQKIMLDDVNKLERGYQAYENQDYTKALNYLQNGVQSGDRKSLLYLGQMYLYGNGVTKDGTQALELLLKAAQDGDVKGQYLVGMMYKDGQGIPKNTENAKFWLGKASAQGYAAATTELNKINQAIAKVEEENKRKEVKKKEETAAERLAVFISKGDSYFNRELYSDAYENLIQAANMGHASSQQKVAWMLYRGKGVRKNKDEAILWWKKAARQGDVESINFLTRLGEW